jgi:hypothetical protein
MSIFYVRYYYDNDSVFFCCVCVPISLFFLYVAGGDDGCWLQSIVSMDCLIYITEAFLLSEQAFIVGVFDGLFILFCCPGEYYY